MRFMIEFVAITQDGCIDWLCPKSCGLNAVGGSFLIFNPEIHLPCAIFAHALPIIIHLTTVALV